MAFDFANLLSAACGGAPRRLGRLRRPWARCARLFWGGYQHRKIAFFSFLRLLRADVRCVCVCVCRCEATRGVTAHAPDRAARKGGRAR